MSNLTDFLFMAVAVTMRTLHVIVRHVVTIHTYTHTYRHTCIHTYMHAYLPTYMHTYLPIYIHTYINAYIHIYIHTYIQIYIHTYIRGEQANGRVDMFL